MEVTDGVTGAVVGLRDQREFAGLQDVIYIDRGADDGVRLGDVFAISSVARIRGAIDDVEQDQARAIVVNTRSRTSSAIIIELYRPDIRAGSVARQTRTCRAGRSSSAWTWARPRRASWWRRATSR